MSQQYIQDIYKLTERIFEDDFEFDSMLAELNTHLARAKRNNALIYEVEALNTTSILYYIGNHHPQSIQCIYEALEKSYLTHDFDLILKVKSNICATLLTLWDLDEAYTVISKCIDMLDKQPLQKISLSYAYGNMARVLIYQARYEEAQAFVTRSLDLIKHIDLRTYSYIEHIQNIVGMHRLQSFIHIAKGQCEQASQSIEQVDQMLHNMESATDFIITNNYSKIIYLLVCKHDEPQAQVVFDDTNQLLDQLDMPMYSDVEGEIACILAHHNQVKWAQCFAQRARDAIPEGQAEVFHKFIDATQAILDLEEPKSEP